MSASIQFVGNVGRDPESKFTPNGAMFTTFSIAVSNGYKKDTPPTWFNCTAWGEGVAGVLKSNVEKGSKVFISGELNIREWKTSEGETRTSNDVKVFSWEVVGKRKAQGEQEASPYDQSDSP